MYSKVNSIGLRGIEGYLVQVESEVIDGLESFVIVGLPDTSVKESKERVVIALHQLGYLLTDRKVVVNLSPVEQKKVGPFHDVATAVALLKSGGFMDAPVPQDAAFLGTLSLNGAILPMEGMLPAILAAKKLNLKKLFLPHDPSIPEINLPSLELVYVHSLKDIILDLSGHPAFHLPSTIQSKDEAVSTYDRDFQQIIGHDRAKRALEIAASGKHHVMMDGPPGCGKSLLAETFPSILPSLSREEQLEVFSLYQLSKTSHHLSENPPFRSPHHSSSAVSLIGGGAHPRPGEVSLAHHGVLFLDELAEYTKKTLDMLRQPLESGKVTISRAQATVTYPAQFIFLAAMNPCPCGHLGSNKQPCSCSEDQIKKYQNRVSGPIRDRIDILLSLSPVHLSGEGISQNETSAIIKDRVEKARELQYQRYERKICNAEVSYQELIEKSAISKKQESFLQQYGLKHGLSNRVQIKILKLARTISDLQNSEEITEEALWEAVTYRKDLISVKTARKSFHY